MYEAKILADSVSPEGVRLTTMQVTFPRIVLAEFNTHRMFSRNSASSRAIPVEKQIQRVMEDPFIPEAWPKNQSGMQAAENFKDPLAIEDLADIWMRAKDYAVLRAKSLLAHGVHKQITNRLLEPFMWHTVIVTATEWENFFNLRANKMAQPEIQRIAYLMLELYTTSKPVVKARYDWHLPLVDGVDFAELWNTYAGEDTTATWLKLAAISCARCARVSYLTHEGKRDPEADLALAEKLRTSGHMSPFEHAAQVFASVDRPVGTYQDAGSFVRGFHSNFRAPWMQYRKLIPNEEVFRG